MFSLAPPPHPHPHPQLQDWLNTDRTVACVWCTLAVSSSFFFFLNRLTDNRTKKLPVYSSVASAPTGCCRLLSANPQALNRAFRARCWWRDFQYFHFTRRVKCVYFSGCLRRAFRSLNRPPWPLLSSVRLQQILQHRSWDSRMIHSSTTSLSPPRKINMFSERWKWWMLDKSIDWKTIHRLFLCQSMTQKWLKDQFKCQVDCGEFSQQSTLQQWG